MKLINKQSQMNLGLFLYGCLLCLIFGTIASWNQSAQICCLISDLHCTKRWDFFSGEDNVEIVFIREFLSYWLQKYILIYWKYKGLKSKLLIAQLNDCVDVVRKLCEIRKTGADLFHTCILEPFLLVDILYVHFISILNPFQNKPCFLRVCCTSLFKILWEKEKLLSI